MTHSPRSFGRALGVENDLGHTLAIAQVDENDRAVVPAVLDPAVKHYFITDIGRADRTAVMGSFELIDETGHESSVCLPAMPRRRRCTETRW